jgi:hypothetical protein
MNLRKLKEFSLSRETTPLNDYHIVLEDPFNYPKIFHVLYYDIGI